MNSYGCMKSLPAYRARIYPDESWACEHDWIFGHHSLHPTLQHPRPYRGIRLRLEDVPRPGERLAFEEEVAVPGGSLGHVSTKDTELGLDFGASIELATDQWPGPAVFD
jgi:hypothetical protein